MPTGELCSGLLTTIRCGSTGVPAITMALYVPVSSLEVIPAANPSYPCCSFRGSLVAIDSETGLLQWRHYTIPDEPKEVGKSSLGTPVLAPSGAPSWSSPTIDIERRLVYIGTGENYSSPAEGNSDAILAINMGDGSSMDPTVNSGDVECCM